jgi:NADH:ubiquinone oxidoreductase subunit C
MSEIFIPAQEWVSHHKKLKTIGFVRFEYVTAIHVGGDEFKFVSLVSKEDLSEQVVSITSGPLDSLGEIFPIADFHEHEIIQMFGVEIAGQPTDAKALEVDFAGHPLRRDFALNDRVERQWPGAVEPDANAKRRPALAPGVLSDWQA